MNIFEFFNIMIHAIISSKLGPPRVKEKSNQILETLPLHPLLSQQVLSLEPA